MILKIEPFVHSSACWHGLGMALASIFLTLFNQVGWDCWISASPLGCEERAGRTTALRHTFMGTTDLCTSGYSTTHRSGLVLLWSPLWCTGYTIPWGDKYAPWSYKDPSWMMQVIVNYQIRRPSRGYFVVGAFYVTSWFFPTVFQLFRYHWKRIISTLFPYGILRFYSGQLNMIVWSLHQ